MKPSYGLIRLSTSDLKEMENRVIQYQISKSQNAIDKLIPSKEGGSSPNADHGHEPASKRLSIPERLSVSMKRSNSIG